MARPTKLTPAVQDKITAALRAGNTRRASARYAGVAEATFYNWLERGRAPRLKKGGEPYAEDVPFLEFLEAVERVEAECEVHYVALIKKAASERDEVTVKRYKGADGTERTETTTRRVFEWQPALAWLERRRSGDWMRREAREHSGLDGGPIALKHAREDLARLTPREIADLYRKDIAAN